MHRGRKAFIRQLVTYCKMNKVAMIEEISSQLTKETNVSFVMNFIRLKTNKLHKTKTTTHQSVHVGPLMSSVVAMWKQGRCYSAVWFRV